MTPLRIGLIAEDYYQQLGGVPEHAHHRLEWTKPLRLPSAADE